MVASNTSDEDSESDDEILPEAERKIDMSSLPMVAKDDKSVQARLSQAQKKQVRPRTQNTRHPDPPVLIDVYI